MRIGQIIDGGCCIAVFVLAGLACGGGSAQRAAAVASAPSTASLTAPQLFAAYSSNEIQADQTYKSKVITVAGLVETIGKDILDTPFLTLSVGEGSLFSVQAMFRKSDEPRLATIVKGKAVAVKCRCDGKLGNIILTDCSLQ